MTGNYPALVVVDYASYAHASRRDVTVVIPPGMAISFIPQCGPCADLTSALPAATVI